MRKYYKIENQTNTSDVVIPHGGRPLRPHSCRRGTSTKTGPPTMSQSLPTSDHVPGTDTTRGTSTAVAGSLFLRRSPVFSIRYPCLVSGDVVSTPLRSCGTSASRRNFFSDTPRRGRSRRSWSLGSCVFPRCIWSSQNPSDPRERRKQTSHCSQWSSV